MPNQVAYGFVNLADLFASRVTEVGVRVINQAIQATADEHTRQINALLALFAQRTTDFKVRYRTSVFARLQPLDESGRALPVVGAGQYDLAFPILPAGIAYGATYLARARSTVEEVNNMLLTLTDADTRWVRDQILGALFAATTWTYQDPEHGALTIKPLANGDTDQYMVMTGADAGATDTHQLAQADAIDTTHNPFPTIYQELVEHPENSGAVLVLVPTDLRPSIMGLSTFFPVVDPNIRPGVGQAVLTGNLGTAIPGELFGYVDKCWVAEWRSLPAGYMLAVTTGGPRPLAMREYPERELQGFHRTVEGAEAPADYPFWESQWTRFAGFGGFNRVGAMAIQIGSQPAAPYAPPAIYTPLPLR